jgi:hypothetical protein
MPPPKQSSVGSQPDLDLPGLSSRSQFRKSSPESCAVPILALTNMLPPVCHQLSLDVVDCSSSVLVFSKIDGPPLPQIRLIWCEAASATACINSGFISVSIVSRSEVQVPRCGRSKKRDKSYRILSWIQALFDAQSRYIQTAEYRRLALQSDWSFSAFGDGKFKSAMEKDFCRGFSTVNPLFAFSNPLRCVYRSVINRGFYKSPFVSNCFEIFDRFLCLLINPPTTRR